MSVLNKYHHVRWANPTSLISKFLLKNPFIVIESNKLPGFWRRVLDKVVFWRNRDKPLGTGAVLVAPIIDSAIMACSQARGRPFPHMFRGDCFVTFAATGPKQLRPTLERISGRAAKKEQDTTLGLSSLRATLCLMFYLAARDDSGFLQAEMRSFEFTSVLEVLNPEQNGCLLRLITQAREYIPEHLRLPEAVFMFS